MFTEEKIIHDTRRWLETTVIGLGLCPFAKAPYEDGRVALVASDASDLQALLTKLHEELLRLERTPLEELETILLIHPQVLGDFLEYNDFLDVIDGALFEWGWEGIFQVASFHPNYIFADTDPNDVENYTNRSPYPTLHLLREESLSRIADSGIDLEAIPQRNIAVLRELGLGQFKDLTAPPNH